MVCFCCSILPDCLREILHGKINNADLSITIRLHLVAWVEVCVVGSSSQDTDMFDYAACTRSKMAVLE